MELIFIDRVRRWLSFSCLSHPTTLYFPPSKHAYEYRQEHGKEEGENSTIHIYLRPAYLIERPFLPFSSNLLFHPGLSQFRVGWIVSQMIIDLSLVFPLWYCFVDPSLTHSKNTTTVSTMEGMRKKE